MEAQKGLSLSVIQAGLVLIAIFLPQALDETEMAGVSHQQPPLQMAEIDWSRLASFISKPLRRVTGLLLMRPKPKGG